MSVDLSGVINDVMQLVIAGLAAVVIYLLKLALGHLEKMAGLQMGQIHGPVIDEAVNNAAADILTKIESVTDPLLKLRVKNALLLEAAQAVVSLEPIAIKALGLTPQAITLKIDAVLGKLLGPLPANLQPTAASSAATDAAPAVAASIASAATMVGTALAVMVLLTHCTATEVATAEADIAAACQDYEKIKPDLAVAEAGAALIPGVGAADAVIAGVQPYVDEFCAAPPATDADSAVWLKSNLGKLTATLPSHA